MSTFYNNLKTVFLLAVLSALILSIGSFFGQGGVLIALVMATLMSFWSYFVSDKIAIMAMRAQEVGPEQELYQIVQELTAVSSMPMPRVYVAPHAAPNAFATGRSPNHAAVCATEGLLRMLSREEVAAVMSHELAHVKHCDILIQSVAATLGAAISYLGYMFI